MTRKETSNARNNTKGASNGERCSSTRNCGSAKTTNKETTSKQTTSKAKNKSTTSKTTSKAK